MDKLVRRVEATYLFNIISYFTTGLAILIINITGRVGSESLPGGSSEHFWT